MPNHYRSLSESVNAAITVLKSAKSVCILTGAGISAESGIPTFRDKQTGLWENYSAEQLANIAAFKRDPNLVWQWYQMRRDMIRDKEPNPAHHALATWQDSAAALNQSITLVSQNVDNLHEQAGSTVQKLHGSIWHNHCIDCETPYLEDTTGKDELLNCPVCDGLIRPSVVWFGESLPDTPWLAADHAARHCDVFMSIGTSSLVYPAAGLATLAKQTSGTTVIEINPNPTESDMVDIQICEKAGMVLPSIINELLAV